MGIPIDPPIDSDEKAFVSFSGIQLCPATIQPPPSGYYELTETPGGNFLYQDAKFTIVLDPGDSLQAGNAGLLNTYFLNEGVGALPFGCSNEQDEDACFFDAFGYDGFAYAGSYTDNGAHIACIDYNLYNRPGTMFEINHIEADYQTFRIANAKDSTNFLMKTESP